MFHRLHIGIDRYAGPHIQWLRGAVRDNGALHALFADTLGTKPVTLADQAATASAIRATLAALASQAADEDMLRSRMRDTAARIITSRTNDAPIG